MTEAKQIGDIKARLNTATTPSEGLEIAISLLLEYERQHLAKPANSGAAKAKTNRQFASRFRDILDQAPANIHETIKDSVFATQMLGAFAETDAHDKANIIVGTVAQVMAESEDVKGCGYGEFELSLGGMTALVKDWDVSQHWTDQGVTVKIVEKKQK
ncbi:hypothetical protein [uncultured Sulfitobacter sp.]|uniref:hypothetical protein n=1 Tax=uncultured Sulfitobacter sp. TaxID=191468 RepID=UPI0025963420|nr:hypothetical protein [uncultured Sulfitobacter sp.]